MMAWGKECSEWDKSVDQANLDDFNGVDIPNDKFVLTTWHDDEPLEEVLWFSQHAAHHDAIPDKRLLLLDISLTPRESSVLAKLANSYDLHVREPN